MRVLVACEFSGVVRRAFRERGHEAWSCDLLPAEDDSPYHVRGDALNLLGEGWDMMIGHPECTYLCNSGVRWLFGGRGTKRDPVRWAKMEAAARFFLRLWQAQIPRIALENPIMHGYAREVIGAESSQIVQPYMFGHGETKATCFWLKGLPRLLPTHADAPLFGVSAVSERVARIHLEPPGPDRWKNRSRTYEGIAVAMAEQWGCLG
jgi:hypothetical protein